MSISFLQSAGRTATPRAEPPLIVAGCSTCARSYEHAAFVPIATIQLASATSIRRSRALQARCGRVSATFPCRSASVRPFAGEDNFADESRRRRSGICGCSHSGVPLEAGTHRRRRRHRSDTSSTRSSEASARSSSQGSTSSWPRAGSRTGSVCHPIWRLPRTTLTSCSSPSARPREATARSTSASSNG